VVKLNVSGGGMMNNKLPLYRLMNGKMTQVQLAEQAGVGLSTVINWEKDINRMTVAKLMKVCEIFDITPNELLLKEESE